MILGAVMLGVAIGIGVVVIALVVNKHINNQKKDEK